MAEEKARKTDAAAESPAEPAPAPAKKSGKGKLFGIVGVVMVLEGVGIFAAMKMMGGSPDPVAAAAPLKVEKQEPDRIEEVELAQFRAPNVKEGKLVLWSLQVALRVSTSGGHGGEGGKGKSEAKEEGHEKPAEKSEGGKAKADSPAVAKIKMNERTIKDRLTRIVRSAEPTQLQEDGLETIKRQMKFELERILGDDVKIVEVLIPECTPFPTGF